MKIRIGFVANSSTSSYIIATKSKPLSLDSLAKIIQKWFQFKRFRDKTIAILKKYNPKGYY